MLWDVFEAAHQYDESDETSVDKFKIAYDKATKVHGTKWNLTTGLYWAHPWDFPTLDSKSRGFISVKLGLSAFFKSVKGSVNSSQYLELIKTLNDKFLEDDSSIKNFPELSYQASLSDENYTEIASDSHRQKNMPVNMILYGPPGTGKTYDTVSKAMQIFNITNDDYLVLKKQFDALKSEGRIEFVTFHQSFSYEDFVEGIRAETNDKGELSYSIKDGIFKKIAIGALFSKFDEEFTEDLDELWEEAKSKNRYQNKITTDDAYDRNNYEHKKLILSACKIAEFTAGTGEPYVLIIDEINRGNTSRVFGELITLIETTKRAGTNEVMDAILPYSQEIFTVPDNLYIIGTMNTADRSLALMDTALRRRFDFIEKMPDISLIKDIDENPLRITVEDKIIDIQLMLQTINDRIEALYDREHTIGHAFFMKLKDEPTVEKLAYIFRNNILPLLEEYFFEDWDKITKILGKSNIYIKKNFDNLGFDYPGTNYSRNDSALENKDTYINIYKLKDIDPDQAQSE